MRNEVATSAAAELSTVRRAASLARKTFAGGTNGGRPPKGVRCACGKMSAKRAATRGHRC